MGISMGSISFGEYLATRGIDVFLVDLRGYGKSSPIAEQLHLTADEVTNPIKLKDFYSDIFASTRYVKSILGNDITLSALGFSIMASILVTFSHICPGELQRVIGLNPTWLPDPSDTPSDYFFEADTTTPYIDVSLDLLKRRFEIAQPHGVDYREPLWFSEATSALTTYHQTFNKDTQSWKIYKMLYWHEFFRSIKDMPDITAHILLVSSQYDAENPLPIVQRLFNTLSTTNKILKILPDATHLCIWEKARHTLYKWTADFILDLC
jgi:alpha-beta hydrolase superfamily lysophospholipase